MTIAAEVFCSWLALKLGIRVPRCRILLNKHGCEGNETYMKLAELDAKKSRTAASKLNREFLLLQEYIIGESLASLRNQDFASSQSSLRQLGFGLAFDMFCHNTDRIPLVVENRGYFRHMNYIIYLAVLYEHV
jgi:hypothetical protein